MKHPIKLTRSYRLNKLHHQWLGIFFFSNCFLVLPFRSFRPRRQGGPASYTLLFVHIVCRGRGDTPAALGRVFPVEFETVRCRKEIACENNCRLSRAMTYETRKRFEPIESTSVDFAIAVFSPVEKPFSVAG